jgi:hypothetical protein
MLLGKERGLVFKFSTDMSIWIPEGVKRKCGFVSKRNHHYHSQTLIAQINVYTDMRFEQHFPFK